MDEKTEDLRISELCPPREHNWVQANISHSKFAPKEIVIFCSKCGHIQRVEIEQIPKLDA